MTRARKEHERLVLFNKRPNPVCVLVDEGTDQPIGIKLEWFPDNLGVSSPTSYFTTDQGATFYRLLSATSPCESGVRTEVRTGGEETNPETLASLRELFAAWGESSRNASRNPAA